MKAFVALRGAKRRPQIGRVFVLQTYSKRARAPHSHAITGIPEIVSERCDEANEAAGFLRAHISSRAARLVCKGITFAHRASAHRPENRGFGLD
jgi:hypothetical protein